MNWLRVRELVRKEFIQLFRDRKNRPMLVIAPLIQVILFGYVVTTDVRDITVAVIDQSRTPDSRRLLDAFDGNPTFRVTRVLQDPKDLDRLLLQARSGHRSADPAGFQRAHPQGRDGRGADPGRRQHEQHGGRANRLQRQRAGRFQLPTPAGAQPPAHRLRRDRRPYPHLVQSQPGQPVLLRAGDRRLPGDAALAACSPPWPSCARKKPAPWSS